MQTAFRLRRIADGPIIKSIAKRARTRRVRAFVGSVCFDIGLCLPSNGNIVFSALEGEDGHCVGTAFRAYAGATIGSAAVHSDAGAFKLNNGLAGNGNLNMQAPAGSGFFPGGYNATVGGFRCCRCRQAYSPADTDARENGGMRARTRLCRQGIYRTMRLWSRTSDGSESSLQSRWRIPNAPIWWWRPCFSYSPSWVGGLLHELHCGFKGSRSG